MGILRQRLMSNPRYHDIPQVLRQKLVTSGTTVVSKQDLDMLPDAIWDEIAQQANLSYSYKEDDSADFDLGEEIGGPAQAPRPSVHHPDPKAVAQQRRDTEVHKNAIKQAAKAQPKPVSKGSSTTVKGSTPAHGSTSTKK